MLPTQPIVEIHSVVFSLKEANVNRIVSFVFLVLFSIPNVSHGQLIKSWGIKIGPAIAGQNWNYSIATGYSNDKIRWGLTVGPFAELFDTHHFCLVVEAIYIQKGFTDNFVTRSDRSGTTTSSPRLDYLSFPILPKLGFAVHPFTLYILAGPRVDILLSNSGKSESEALSNVDSFDFGASVGSGVECSLNAKLRIGLEARFSPSLRDIHHSTQLAIRNHSFEMLFTIGFDSM
jgi:hypothetical protein